MWAAVERILAERYPELAAATLALILGALQTQYTTDAAAIVVLGKTGRVKYGETLIQLDLFPLGQFSDIPNLPALYVGYLPGAFYLATNRSQLCQALPLRV